MKKIEFNYYQKTTLMKNLKQHSKQILTFILLIFLTTTFAQNTYLKITQKDTLSISYPPETKFELKNKHGYIILKNNNTPRIFKIEENYTLLVYPSYKSEIDVFELTTGKIELIKAKYYKKGKFNLVTYQSNNETAEFTISDSESIKNSKNLHFKLSNGMTFKYTDGKYNAYLNTEENYLNIEGKYYIESKLGVLKISFNPNNGEIWWVFEPKK